MRLSLCSAKGSPGVSTLACLAAAVWPTDRSVVLAECDPSGNDLVPRFGLSPHPGMATLVAEARTVRHPVVEVAEHLQRIRGGLATLAGPPGCDAARTLDMELAYTASTLFPPLLDFIFDCGRIVPGAPGQEELFEASDHVLVLTRGDPAAMTHARSAFLHLEEAAPATVRSLLVMEPLVFELAEMQQALGATFVARLPDDPAGAAVACGAPGHSRALERSRLVRAARKVVKAVVAPDAQQRRDETSRDAAR